MSVAVPPFTHANPVAHGGVTYIETCWGCGATREVNENAGQREFGVWGSEQHRRYTTEEGF